MSVVVLRPDDAKAWKKQMKSARKQGLTRLALVCIQEMYVEGKGVGHKLNLIPDIIKTRDALDKARRVAEDYAEQVREHVLPGLENTGRKGEVRLWVHPVVQDSGTTLQEAMDTMRWAEEHATPETIREMVGAFSQVPALAEVTLPFGDAVVPVGDLDDLDDLMGRWGFGKVNPGSEA